MDATFKVMKEPFKQLFTIHAFLKSEGQVKQVPLVHALMSRRRQPDYERVLQEVRDYNQETCKHVNIRLQAWCLFGARTTVTFLCTMYHEGTNSDL